LSHDPSAASARRDFLKRFFHDLATPLSAAALHLEGVDRRLRKGTDPAESLAVARAELARAFDLFDLGRDVLLEESAEPEKIDLDAVAAEVAAGYPGVTVEGRAGVPVLANRASITAALSALVVNAVEAASAAQAQVRLERDRGQVRIRVENPGSLGTDNPEALFSPKAARSGRKWGMGLARGRLALAEAGGSLRLEQRDGRVVATLELPEETA
jgi:signal transduction histidine kinase